MALVWNAPRTSSRRTWTLGGSTASDQGGGGPPNLTTNATKMLTVASPGPAGLADVALSSGHAAGAV
jgi:hypothetical protein